MSVTIHADLGRKRAGGKRKASVFVNNCRGKRIGHSIFLLAGKPTEALLRREPWIIVIINRFEQASALAQASPQPRDM